MSWVGRVPVRFGTQLSGANWTAQGVNRQGVPEGKPSEACLPYFSAHAVSDSP